MKNHNYNLVKLLHSALDNIWRIEKHYADDVEGQSCKCSGILDQIKKDSKRHADMLLAEISGHDLTE